MGGYDEQTDLIKNFVEVSSKAKGLLEQNKVSEAKQVYLELLEVYNEINNSSLMKYHKEIAHQELTNLHSAISNAKEPFKLPHIPLNVAIAAILIIVFGVFVIMNPKIAGLASLSDTLTLQMNKTIKESGIIEVTLLEKPLSLSATGKVTGKAKLYLKQGENLRLIFDSEKNKNKEGTFIDVCEDTCSINANSNAIELFAALEKGSELFLESLQYKVKRKKNSPPVWTGKTKEFTLTEGQGELNLDNYFSDPDGDKLVYLATLDEGIDIVVNGNILTAKAKPGSGKKSITLIASDLEDVVKVPVTINVK
ncbi:hypothetical protein DRJ22_04690 [Candidatus Woesearchaeota archaeon]|nr:MAG: hypothetical protein DRJ22_04690 [Candidatus Woesearchaeota archaeon]